MDDLDLPGGPVLVLAPHPDDESLGCGRLLSALWEAGRPAHVLCLTDGAASHPRSRSYPPERLSVLRKDEMRTAVSELGGRASDLTFLDLPDAGLHLRPVADGTLNNLISDELNRSRAATLVAPSPLDPHCDHEAAAAVARALSTARAGLKLIFYPIWSRWIAVDHNAPVPAGFRPLIWRAGDVARKRAAIDAYASQQGRIIKDDPTAFAMPQGFADFFADAPEIYFGVQP